MASYYLWAYPDARREWIGVGWVNGTFERPTPSSGGGYTSVLAAVRAFPIDDAGWWYASHNPTDPVPDQMGRYETSYYDPKLPGMTRLVSEGDV